MASTLLSMLFYLTMIIYFYVGMHAYYLNPKERINRSFFYLCCSTSVWAFSFSLMNHAETIGGGRYLFLMSVIGWGTFYSILLHHLILTSGLDIVLKRKQLAAIYFPVPVTVVIFFISASGGELIQVIRKHDKSWLIYQPDILLDSWMALYFAVFMMLAIFLVSRNLKKSTDRVLRKEILAILVGLHVSLIIGIFTVSQHHRPSP